MSRQLSDNEDINVLTTGFYHCYTNGKYRVVGSYRYAESQYRRCSYTCGPWEGSDIYPATRYCLNILSGWSYSPAAAGHYMNNLITLPTYPIYIIELPIQFCLDTILLPFDIWNTPKVPEGYQKVR